MVTKLHVTGCDDCDEEERVEGGASMRLGWRRLRCSEIDVTSCCDMLMAEAAAGSSAVATVAPRRTVSQCSVHPEAI